MKIFNPWCPDLIKIILTHRWPVNNSTAHIVHRWWSYIALIISFSFIFLISCMCNKNQKIWQHWYKELNPQWLLELLQLEKLLQSRHSFSLTALVFDPLFRDTSVWSAAWVFLKLRYKSLHYLSPALISNGQSTLIKLYIYPAGICWLCSTLFCHNGNGGVIPVQSS